jgi:superoxide reductase
LISKEGNNKKSKEKFGVGKFLKKVDSVSDINKNLGDLIYTYDMAAGEALGKRESHTPKIEIPAKIKADEAFELKVSVGPHPNTLEHSIRWMEIYFYEEGRAFNPQMLSRVEFSPALTEPSVTLTVKLQKKGVIHAVEYCNLHGLWSDKKEITL